jgi:alpha-mannosidase
MSTLHFVPHTHWDREWYLTFQTSRVRLVHLLDGLLDLLERDSTYTHFTLDGQTIVLDDYLAVRPERREQLERFVRAGRLLIGPWTVLPDEFLVSPESLVRNLRLGRQKAAEFGGSMSVGYVPDPFGHIGQLPQILRGFGIEDAAFRRGLGPEPCELWWEAPDGSRVLVSYLREGYDNAARLPREPAAFAAAVAARDRALVPHSAVSHRLFLNGTDHHEPQPELPGLLAIADTGVDDWRMSTLPAFLGEVRKEVEARSLELPVVRGELRDPSRHHLLPGVLSSRTWIKQRNDACERALELWAEPFAAWAEHFSGDQTAETPGGEPHVWTGQLELPRVRAADALIDTAWQRLLECHPHDSICGCSIDQVHDEMRPRFDEVEQIASEVTRQSLVALAEQVDTRALAEHGAVQALVVFNTHHSRRSDVARVDLALGGGLDRYEIIDTDGRVVPHVELAREERGLAETEYDAEEVKRLARGISDGRVLGLAIEAVGLARRGAEVSIDLVLSERGEPDVGVVNPALAELDRELASGGVERVRVSSRFATGVELELVAADLPGHGFRAFGVRAPTTEAPATDTDAEARSISNGLLSVEAAEDGAVCLRDLASGAVFEGVLVPSDVADRGDSYNFCALEGDTAITGFAAPPRVTREITATRERLTISGSLRLPRALAANRRAREAETVDVPLSIAISLVPGVARSDVEVELDNTASDHRLQLLFPAGAGAAASSAVYDGHFELVERPTGVAAGQPDWSEQPVAEQPVRAFVAVRSDAGGEDATGLCVGSRGLREASVAPDGTIALTLLRSTGWLSRPDLASRAGGAGPTMRTPGCQSPGPHRIDLCVAPFRGRVEEGTLEARAFQAPPRGVGTRIHAGVLPVTGSLLAIDSPGFQLTAVHTSANPIGDGHGAVVARGVWHGGEPARVRLSSLASIRAAQRVRLDETALEPLALADGAVEFAARPGEVVTVRLELDAAR